MWSVVKDVVKVDIFVQPNFCFGVVTEMVASWQASSKEDRSWCLVGHYCWYCGELTSRFGCGPTPGREEALAVGDL